MMWWSVRVTVVFAIFVTLPLPLFPVLLITCSSSELSYTPNASTLNPMLRTLPICELLDFEEGRAHASKVFNARWRHHSERKPGPHELPEVFRVSGLSFQGLRFGV